MNPMRGLLTLQAKIALRENMQLKQAAFLRRSLRLEQQRAHWAYLEAEAVPVSVRTERIVVMEAEPMPSGGLFSEACTVA